MKTGVDPAGPHGPSTCGLRGLQAGGPPAGWPTKTVVDSGSGRQWQWQTVAESDDEEAVAATKAQPANTRGLAEPAVAEPAEPAQMSVDDGGMGGPKGRIQGTRYQCQGKGEGRAE